MIRLLLIFILLTVSVQGQETNKNDLSQFFEGIEGCFVLYNYNDDSYTKYNEERCAKRFLPASTFKVPNSLIGLETGVIEDENFVIKWDGVERSIKSWNRDHNLASAIKNSVVPYYKELARRVGKDKIQMYLNKLNYGNKIIGDSVDTFWLDNSLQISADEQIDFLKRLYENKLPFLQRSIDITKKILILEETEDYVFRAKTGTGIIGENNYKGWYVGYVETKDNCYIFALNIDGSNFQTLFPLRIELTRKILSHLGII